ncbi:MAG: hypothetical protein WKG07_20805 [Hymenobacter sp.]
MLKVIGEEDRRSTWYRAFTATCSRGIPRPRSQRAGRSSCSWTGLYLWWPRNRKGLAGVLYPRLGRPTPVLA